MLLRLVVALLLGNRVEVMPGIHDQLSYDALAQSILAGRGYQFDAAWYPFTPANMPTAHWSFLYPLYLAGVYGLFGYNPLAARIIQAVVVAILTCWLVYSFTRRLFGAQVGLVAAAIAAVYTYFVYYSGALMTESFFMVAALAVIETTYRLLERPTVGLALLLGLVSGLAVLLRQTFIFFIPVLLLWLWWRGRERIKLGYLALPVLVAGAMILPWTVRNYQVYGQFLLLNSNAGYAFFSSVHPSLGAEWTAAKSVTPVPREWLALNEAALDRRLTSTAVQFILDDPGRYVLLTLSKFEEQFKFWPTPDSGLISNVQRVLSFALLWPFALYGIYLARGRWREWSLLLLFFALISAVHLLTWPSARYRVPTDACLMPFAALAIVHLYARFFSRRSPKELVAA